MRCILIKVSDASSSKNVYIFHFQSINPTNFLRKKGAPKFLFQNESLDHSKISNSVYQSINYSTYYLSISLSFFNFAIFQPIIINRRLLAPHHHYKVRYNTTMPTKIFISLGCVKYRFFLQHDSNWVFKATKNWWR